MAPHGEPLSPDNVIEPKLTAENWATEKGEIYFEARCRITNCRFEETTSSNFQAHGFDFPKRPQILNSMKMAFMAAR